MSSSVPRRHPPPFLCTASTRMPSLRCVHLQLLTIVVSLGLLCCESPRQSTLCRFTFCSGAIYV